MPEFTGIQAVETGIVHAGDRTFLESVRSDRHDRSGRSAVCTWAAINYAWFGLAGRAWTEGAASLRVRGLIEPHIAEDIACLWHFGRLIANSDKEIRGETAPDVLRFTPGCGASRAVVTVVSPYA